MEHGFKLFALLALWAVAGVSSANQFGNGLTIQSATGNEQYCMDAQRDGAAIVIDDCQPRALQTWFLRQ